MRLRLSKLALADLEEIHDFTQNRWGEEQATHYLGMLWDALEEIQMDPTRWRLRPDIHKEARVRVCGRHLIIYRIHNERVEVSRLLHGARKLPENMPPSFSEPE